jgi:hypothetical protein
MKDSCQVLNTYLKKLPELLFHEKIKAMTNIDRIYVMKRVILHAWQNAFVKTNG